MSKTDKMRIHMNGQVHSTQQKRTNERTWIKIDVRAIGKSRLSAKHTSYRWRTATNGRAMFHSLNNNIIIIDRIVYVEHEAVNIHIWYKFCVLWEKYLRIIYRPHHLPWCIAYMMLIPILLKCIHHIHVYLLFSFYRNIFYNNNNNIFLKKMLFPTAKYQLYSKVNIPRQEQIANMQIITYAWCIKCI